MAKYWDNIIDKNTSWDGDNTTENLPVRGTRIEEFLKNTLNDKFGVLYYDVTNNRNLIFADKMDLEEYLEDPTKVELVKGTFDAPFNYTAEINLTSSTYNAVFLGSTGNYINFTFDVKNKQGSSTGENVTVTYTFIRNAVKKTYTETYKFGEAVNFNIDKYLEEGTNTIIVGITGQTTLAATTVAITYQVVDLSIQDEYDTSTVYDLSVGSKVLEVPYSVSGYGTKIVEWYIDGELLTFSKVEDEIVDTSATRTKYISLSNLSQGTHSYQVRAYTTINGEKFYTDTLYREFAVYTGIDNNIIISIATTIPYKYGILSSEDEVSIYDMVQYIPYNLRFSTYSPINASNTEVEILLDDISQGTINTKNGIENIFTLISKTSGNKVVTLNTQGVSRTIPINVAPTTMNLQEITSNLVLNFTALGKNNNSEDRDTWVGNGYTATLTGFNWTNTSGWVNNRLEMNAGSSLAIDLAPLANNPTNSGRTIEIEWSTKNVFNDDEVICDLRQYGVGILITATKVSLTSANGVVVETEYKSDENVRIGFVINKTSGSTNKRMSFIYTNGVISKAEAWGSSDSYTANVPIVFSATPNAEISLKEITVYNTALTSDQMLNNFNLHRDTISEMMEVYDRNDVYEEGTTTFSPTKMVSRLPRMIITGDIPTLENTSDKDTQIIVDIDYENLQDPTRNFKMVGAAMRPQGTSSMGYPKKNFRIYTQKVDGTILYDYLGNIVQDKLYSFKEGAQPVNCWCLKADYAESSGTHNTGIARLWNDALVNARVTVNLGEGNPHNVDNAPVLRTKAQNAAIEAGYPYDVRTAIDGFPILLFYRPSENDDIIFIGKYNFNNDKSTESVFGFVGIPEFDNSNVQCWEILNNGNALALFTSTDNFDENWSEAFESRYPDTKSPNTEYLKTFSEWMTNVSEDNFATEKWEHLDVFKIAAYWIYLHRHAAADQFVKNAMFTTEDGVLFFYILYDNDTINGLINTGRLKIKPTDNRQTIDESGAYLFAGHDSRLWNLLENDEEFNIIVSAVDNALYSAGISYNNTIKIFDEEQADKWVERVYNQDAQYKYIGPYVERGINNLFMLQGKRDLHRRWWLAKRFAIYDAKFVSGTYKSQAIEIKCINGTPAGQQFTVTSGYPLAYGFGINNVPREFGVDLNIGESHTFTTQEVVNVGDPIRIYAAPNIAELDLSPMTKQLAVVTVANANDEALGTHLTKLIVGNANQTNMEVTEISGLAQLSKLEYLDVQGMTKLTSLDLVKQPYFKTLKAFGSNIGSVSFSKGAPVERLELPASMTTLVLEQLPYLTSDNLVLERKENLVGITIKNCPTLTQGFSFVYDWYKAKTTADSRCTLVMDNINWEGISASQLIEVLAIKQNGGTLDLQGKITLPDATLDEVKAIEAILGKTVFDKNSQLYIEVPTFFMVEGSATTINEGESATFSTIVYPLIEGDIEFELTNSRTGASIDSATGVLTTTENGVSTSTLNVKATLTPTDGSAVLTATTSIVVAKRVYPTNATINGSGNLLEGSRTYTWSTTTANVNGNMVAEWVLSGDATTVAEIVEQDVDKCVIGDISAPTELLDGVLTLTLKKVVDGTTVTTATMEVQAIMEGVIITSKTNAPIQRVLYAAGLVANETYTLKEEAEAITAEQLQPGSSAGTSIFYSEYSNIRNFREFKYFTGVLYVPERLFDRCTSLTEIDLPSTITRIEDYAFNRCLGLQRIYIPSSVTYIGYDAFYCYYTETGSLKYVDIDDLQSWCSIDLPRVSSGPFALAPNNGISAYLRINGNIVKEVNLPNDFTVKSYAFACQGIEKVSFGVSTSLKNHSFSYMHALKQVVLPEGLSEITNHLFYNCTALEFIDIPESVHTINRCAFDQCTNLKSITGGEGVTTIPLKANEGDPFWNISKEVTIASECAFSLVWCSVNGSYLKIKGSSYKDYRTMSSYINTVINGSCQFSTDTNNYFEGGVTDMTVTISHTGKLEDVADRVKIHSHNLELTTNRNDAQFEISYTDVDSGETSNMIVTGGGTYKIPAKDNTTLVVSPKTEYEGYVATAVTITTKINSYAWTAKINYIEKTDIYIQHIDGTLYTKDEWTAGGYANDQANGVAVVCADTSFVMAKTRISGLAWGGNNIDLSTVLTPYSNETAAILDFDGASNTEKIISALNGVSDYGGIVGAPVAEACVAYVFPNGNTGYLGSAGQWQRVCDNRTVIHEAFSKIGFSSGINSTSYRFWTSTIKDELYYTWLYKGASELYYTTRGYTSYYAIPFTTID